MTIYKLIWDMPAISAGEVGLYATESLAQMVMEGKRAERPDLDYYVVPVEVYENVPTPSVVS